MNNPSSQLKGMDLVRWLDNKLGDPSELWAGRQASSVLNREILNELANCFQALEPHVKLKIIEAIPHLSPKLIQMWREPLTRLLEIAQDDGDNWIRTIAKMYIQYPSTGAIKCDITDTDEQFAGAVNEFQKILDTTVPIVECNVIPPDFLIVTPAATQMVYGYSDIEPKRHFSLKKPLKAEKTLQDALRVAQNSHNPVKRSAPGITSSLPIRVRSTIGKPDNTLPMRGIPSIPVSKISSGFSNEPKKFRNFPKREGGAVLIDFSDLPQAPNMKKRRGPALKVEDPQKDPKKKGGGKKLKNSDKTISNQQASSTNDPYLSLETNEEHQHGREETMKQTDTTPQTQILNPGPFAPPMMSAQRRMDNVMDGAFSFI